MSHRKDKTPNRTRICWASFAGLCRSGLESGRFPAGRLSAGERGGVDILAGKGVLGLEEPRICVQVKATASSAGIDVINSLLGVVAGYGATYGLVVSLGGFTKDARNKAKDEL